MKKSSVGFAPIIIILGIVLLLGIVGGAYYFGKNTNTAVKNNPVITPTPTSIPTVTPKTDETANWKTYINTDYGYSIKYPSPLNQGEIQKSDIYLSSINFKSAGTDSEWFNIMVRNSSLQDEIKYQRSQIEGHISAKLTKNTEAIVDGFSGVLLEYTPDSPEIGNTIRLVIVNNRKYSYTINGTPKILDQVLATFKFLDQQQTAAEGKDCGGIAGETGQMACPAGYYCKYPTPMYPDANGKCAKE